ncbi:division/cell wall cluster transcriptional repressor MraZ [Ureaplasma canigenitalium]|uniref:division/cell wall cluster transcriptional repressor MraZ n=1 Tax=Ureaplasma canigenitalium TaxID=42092 RepID=UPI001FDED57F|nr:division/cell wall cluster transcriptional repressor MraZ [Ureaplasma canigenitalium]
MIFSGTYQLVIDNKNRISVPSKVRTLFNSSTVYLSLGIDGNIDLFLVEDFQNYIAKFKELSIANANARRFVRTILANSFKVDIDNNNRILVPQILVDKAKLTKDLYLIGNDSKFEIWAKEMYDEYLDGGENSLSNLAEGLSNELF